MGCILVNLAQFKLNPALLAIAYAPVDFGFSFFLQFVSIYTYNETFSFKVVDKGFLLFAVLSCAIDLCRSIVVWLQNLFIINPQKVDT